jgi:hypothetical protein
MGRRVGYSFSESIDFRSLTLRIKLSMNPVYQLVPSR